MGRDYPKFEGISPKLLYDGMKKSYENAEDYLYEAELLYKMRKYGRSASLSVLGLEELSKSIDYLFLLTTKITPQNILLTETDPDHSNEADPNKVLRDLYNHRLKHARSFAFTFMSRFFFKDFLIEFIKLSEEDMMNVDVSKEIFKKITKNSKKRMSNVKRIEGEMEFIQGFQEMKEKGIYVEINVNNELSTPKSIRAKESKKCMKILEKYLDEWEIIPGMYWDISNFN